MEVQYPLLLDQGIRLPRLGSHDDDKTQETSGSYGETAYLPPDTIINQQLVPERRACGCAAHYLATEQASQPAPSQAEE